jgi:hypothetical protein
LDDVRLMYEVVQGRCHVKAAGGIREIHEVLAYLRSARRGQTNWCAPSRNYRCRTGPIARSTCLDRHPVPVSPAPTPDRAATLVGVAPPPASRTADRSGPPLRDRTPWRDRAATLAESIPRLALERLHQLGAALAAHPVDTARPPA